MKYLLYWLPAVAAVLVAALVIHSPVVDAWHDWTTGWHRYQLVALGQVAGIAIGVWCFLVLFCWYVVNERPLNKARRKVKP